MIEIDLMDPNLGKNIDAIKELKKYGMADEEIQKLYDKQLYKDKKNQNGG